MCKTGTISLIFLLVFGVLAIQESPYWLYSIPFLILAIVIPLIKGMWDASGWMSEQTNEMFSKEKITFNFELD